MFLKFKYKIKFLGTFWIMMVFSVILSSCAWWEKQEIVRTTSQGSEECNVGNAPFVVNQIIKSSNDEAISITYEDSLAKSFTLNLKTCIRDSLRQDSPIQNAPFVVEYYSSPGVLEKAKTISDTQGCIQWQEQYKYKYTVKPMWIGLERTIKKENGAYAGATTIPMAVNPWLSSHDKGNGLPSILDMRCEYSREHHIFDEPKNYNFKGLEYLEKTTKREQPLLFADTVSMQIREINPEYLDQNADSSNQITPLGENEIRSLLKKYQQPCELMSQNKSSNSNQNCYKRTLEMVVFLPLDLRTLDMSGSLTDNALNGGTYDVETQLIISPDGSQQKNYLLHEKICKQDNIKLTQKNKSLSFTCRFNISYFNENALFKLAIRVKPSLKTLPFKNFEGVYTVSKMDFQNERKEFHIDTVHDEDYKNVLNTNSELKIIQAMDIRVIELQNEPVKSTKTTPTETPLRQELHFEEGQVQEVNFYPLFLDGYGEYKLSHIKNEGSICADKENVVQRIAVFVGKVCITDILVNQKIKSTPFRVFLEKPINNKIETSIKEVTFGSQKQQFKTDGGGCISIPISLKHNLYDRQKYFKVDVHVLSEKLNLYGKVRLALSPWQRAFQAFQDAQNLDEEIIRFKTDGVAKPELIINQFKSINLFPSYGLDKLLNIHLFHRIYLLFQPFVRRPDNLALGLVHRSRELLRDGHYLVRIMILRNPQETGNTKHFSRVMLTENQDKERANNITESKINLEGATYITHTDSVVVAEANFINFYMPLYLTTQQFYYIASRNFIVIEIYPADPKGFKYNEKCELDTKKTVWKPFKDHDLINYPYVGAMNIQNWMNWNLVQAAKNINTDKIIEQSKIGKKYKHFNLNSSEAIEEIKPLNQVPSGGCVNNIYDLGRSQSLQQTLIEVDKNPTVPSQKMNPSDSDLQNCITDEKAPMALSPALEAHKQKEERRLNSTNVLHDFAQENSLKLVTLSKGKDEKFVQDMLASFKKYNSSYKDVSLKTETETETEGFNIFDLFDGFGDFDFLEIFDKVVYSDNYDFINQIPEEDKEILEWTVEAICTDDSSSLFPSLDEIQDCRAIVFSTYFKDVIEASSQHDSLLSLLKMIVAENLIDHKKAEAFKHKLKQCENDPRVQECYDATKSYVLEALDLALDLLKKRYILTIKILNIFSLDEKQALMEQLTKCSNSIFSFTDEKDCYYEKLKDFYNERSISRKKWSLVSVNDKQKQQQAVQTILENLKNSSKGINHKVLKNYAEPNKNSLTDLIDQGIKSNNRHDPNVFLFAKSLCLFWFDFYIKDYLEAEQKISAYTNYIQKFDYRQMMDQSFDGESKGSFSGFIDHIIDEEGEDSETFNCYEQYTKCLLKDHCPTRSIKQNRGICPYDIQSINDKTCNNLLVEECKKESPNSLCDNKCLLNPNSDGCNGQNSCNKEVRYFCNTNKDQEICEKYDARCVDAYLPCLNKAANKQPKLFNTNNVIKYQSKEFSPLETCIDNPYEFFKFENNMIVHKLSKQNPRYEGGFLENFNVAANFSIGSYMNWTAQRGRSISANAKSTVGAGLGEKTDGGKGKGFVAHLRSFLKLGVAADLGLGQFVSSNESKSSRRAGDARVGEGLFLTIGRANITVGVTEFQKCLVIKPRANAFTAKLSSGEPELYEDVWTDEVKDKNFKKIMISRPGLILCNDVEKREENQAESITESYYYISHQVDAQNSQFLNLYDLANRPFLMILRGRKEFVKLYHLLNLQIGTGDGILSESPENMFVNYPFPIEKSIGLSLVIREFSETGFHPGVYSYPDNSAEAMNAWFANRTSQNPVLDTISEFNLFDPPSLNGSTFPVNE